MYVFFKLILWITLSCPSPNSFYLVHESTVESLFNSSLFSFLFQIRKSNSSYEKAISTQIRITEIRIRERERVKELIERRNDNKTRPNQARL